MYFNDSKKNTNIDHELVKSKILNNKIIKKIKNVNKRDFTMLDNKYIKYGFILFGILFVIVIVYSIFIYHPVKYYLELKGNDDIVIYQGMDFVDPGYVAYDSEDNNYDDLVVVYGNVDSSLVGEYIITYEFRDIYASRVVTVLEADQSHRTYLLLRGEKTMYVEKGTEFVDPKADVIDSTDRYLIDELQIDGNVDVNTSGTYKIKYSITNSVGVTLTTERTVVVMGLDDVSINYSMEYTNNNVIVDIGILSNLFDYVELPDGSVSSSKFLNLSIPENGLYRINVHGKNGDSQVKDFYIDSIDRINPEGSCDGYYKDGKSYVTVYAKDDYSGVSSIVFGDQIYYQSNIIIDREYSNPEFMIYDNAGNTTKVNCRLENKNSIASNNYVKCVDTTIYKGKTYSLSASQKKKLAAMAYNEDSYSNSGLRAVISHMANLYEYQVWSGAIKSSTSLYDYITTTTWYAAGTRKRQYNDKTMAKVLPMIDDILGRGNRTIPLFVNNFDLFPNDIISPKNVSTYRQGETLYDSIYGAKNHKFWCFSLNSRNNSGNLYGYSSDKYKNYVS